MPVNKVARRNGIPRSGIVRRFCLKKLENVFGIRKWKRAQEQYVNHAEYCCIGADAQSERYDHNKRKAGGFAE
jgi:hypothetical protein